VNYAMAHWLMKNYVFVWNSLVSILGYSRHWDRCSLVQFSHYWRLASCWVALRRSDDLINFCRWKYLLICKIYNFLNKFWKARWPVHHFLQVFRGFVVYMIVPVVFDISNLSKTFQVQVVSVSHLKPHI